ncbi:uncharacterized protein IUM83_04759 [Phytophthora cinnamomi]|uniref:uncharacterized protein n=1 Tax=Phytophthora cinnamomi TaxID=4785 RepID=UPI00355A634D|nr:hypothetical protein IUM83_04759 [Phytophthora cinnamomi]
MQSRAVPTIFLFFVLLLLGGQVSAWNGEVTFYSDVKFEGPKYHWGFSKAQRCFNLACWDNRALSVKWKGLPTVGSFSGKARIAFYVGQNCTGDSRDWSTNEDNYPQDFTLDGINNAVSSFAVWQYGKKISNGQITPCPWGTS